MTDEPRDLPVSTDDTPTEDFRRSSDSIAISVENYRLLQRIAGGGMGEVYEAQQLEPIRRRVALKVIKLGMDTEEVVARFESERQALAIMNHPNIAGVFDGGATDQGRPFFAMEYVQGESITVYCDRHRLTTKERLELFLQVCGGVQHAHHKGIIHRDIKPSNVMIAIQDDRPVPKIIDFGVAKATSQPLTERPAHTSLGAFIGTPEYMSPEQAEMTGLDVDTRTDVYSLGVLLYELLVGELPFDSAALRRAGYAEIQRRIRDDEPPRPSTRVTGLGEDGRAIARNRQAELPVLARELRGDLDWIILKALEKDRTRRYETANALAMDIQRHLDHQPVHASPPSTVYRARKFVRRHRAGVVAASLVVLALLAGMVGTTLGLLRARTAERQASEEAETARQVSEFLVGLFRSADPNEAQGDQITARQLLDEGAQRIERGLAEQPLTQARLMHTIGSVYRDLGFYDEARPLLAGALSTRQRLLGDDALETAESLDGLGELLMRRGTYEEAEEMVRQALEIFEPALGADDPRVAQSLASLAWALIRQENREAAEPLLTRALAIRQGTLGADHPDTADSLSDLGIFRWQGGDYDAAEPLLREALEVYERSLGPNDFRIRSTLNDLAVLNWSQGRLDQAAELYERSLTIRERALGPDHPEVATTLNNLALIHDAQDRPEAALPLLERAVAINRAALGEIHDRTAMVVANLAWINYRLSNFDTAEALYRRALAAYEGSVGPDHTNVAIVLRDRARLETDLARYEESERLLTRSLAIFEGALGGDHPEVAATLVPLAEVYKLSARLDDAEAAYRRALEIRRAKLPADHPDLAATLAAYAQLLRESGREAQAEALVSSQS